MASSDLRGKLSCSICLDIYTDPVTLMCGHNFCRGCIDRVLDAQVASGEYSCPGCCTRFIGRPVLLGNVTLCNTAKRFQSTQPEGTSGVLCTHCIHAPVPAVKSCLHCEASLCSDHLRVHSKSPEHVLCEPTTEMVSRKCTAHRKVLEYYCPEDSALICVSCRLEAGHQGHQVEFLDKASEKRRRQLFQLFQKLTSKKSEMEKGFQSLEERKKSVHDMAAHVEKKITTMFGEIRRQLEDLEKKVLMEVSRQEEQRSLTVHDQIRQLEIKMVEMSKKMRHIEALCHTSDPVTILQEQLSALSERCDYEEGLMANLSFDGESHEADDLCMDPISNKLQSLSDLMKNVARGFYIPHPTNILLDVATAGEHIIISNDLKVATYSETKNDLPITSERFKPNQVMSRQSFISGVHYWDVEGSEPGMWTVGMCYPSIERAGPKSIIGANDKSWALEYFAGEYTAIHDSKEVNLSGISCQRLRIHLDYEAGQLTFYELGHPIKHLYTFSATFTEPLCAAFWLGWDMFHKDSWVRIEDCEK